MATEKKITSRIQQNMMSLPIGQKRQILSPRREKLLYMTQNIMQAEKRHRLSDLRLATVLKLLITFRLL